MEIVLGSKFAHFNHLTLRRIGVATIVCRNMTTTSVVGVHTDLSERDYLRMRV